MYYKQKTKKTLNWQKVVSIKMRNFDIEFTEKNLQSSQLDFLFRWWW